MDPRKPADAGASAEAADFVRYCYRRRRTGWPELYDEMCAVASRGLYKGWSFAELAEHGIGFSLFEMPALAAIVSQIAAEDAQRRSHTIVPKLIARHGSDVAVEAVDTPDEVVVPLVAAAAAG